MEKSQRGKKKERGMNEGIKNREKKGKGKWPKETRGGKERKGE